MSLHERMHTTIEQLDNPESGPLDLVALRDTVAEAAKALQAQEAVSLALGTEAEEQAAAYEALETERNRYRTWLREQALSRARALQRDDAELRSIEQAGTFDDLHALHTRVTHDFEETFQCTPAAVDISAVQNRALAAYRV